MRVSLPAVMLLPMFFSAPAFAAEADFVKSLSGSWNGSGTVMTRIGGGTVNVKCALSSTSSATSFSMAGTCRGLLVVVRKISADLKVSGQRYTGTYIGPAGQPSALSGVRRGNTISLAVRWAKIVNGDRDADMTIQKIGTDGLRLQTIDQDPKTGKSIVTSSVTLRRQ